MCVSVCVKGGGGKGGGGDGKLFMTASFDIFY